MPHPTIDLPATNHRDEPSGPTRLAAARVAQFLDPVERFVVLSDELPALRRRIGPEWSERMDQVQSDIAGLLLAQYRQQLPSVADFGEYLSLLDGLLRDSEIAVRRHRVVEHAGDGEEALLQQLVRVTKIKTIALLESRL